MPTYPAVSHGTQAAVAGHVSAAGFVPASQSASFPIEHVTAPGVPDPAAWPHAVAHPVAGAAFHVPWALHQHDVELSGVV